MEGPAPAPRLSWALRAPGHLRWGLMVIVAAWLVAGVSAQSGSMVATLTIDGVISPVTVRLVEAAIEGRAQKAHVPS